MRTVEMHLPPNELSSEMAAMRVWLDEHRFEPSSFSCNGHGAAVLVRLDFKVEIEAEAFAQRFGGHMNGPPAVGTERRFGWSTAPAAVVG